MMPVRFCLCLGWLALAGGGACTRAGAETAAAAKAADAAGARKSSVEEATNGRGLRVVGRASVVDGDTIAIRKERIRIHGIDAPESGQRCLDRQGEPFRCGQKASFVLQNLLRDRTVHCTGIERDRYGRLVATCRVGEVDVAEHMVRTGWATAYRRYSKKYVAVEVQARSEGLGMWAGSFVEPSRWRRGDRLADDGAP